MEEITRKFTVATHEGDIINLIEYSFPIDMSEEKQRDIINISRYNTEDGRTVEQIDGGYQILGETKIYFEQ
jgi:hypothetical protein